MPPRKPIALLTIGQTPRNDLVPEMLDWIGEDFPVVQLGALDGLDAAEIAALGPAAGEARLVTRLRDGSQVVLAHTPTQARVQAILDGIDPAEVAATVLLCTGSFPGLRGPGLFMDSQSLVDHGVEAICERAGSLGVILPLSEQADDFHYHAPAGQRMVLTHSSPYASPRFREAGAELAACDVIVMHCMGYTEGMRREVVEASGRPVLLARRLVAAALAQLV
ncbi:MAG: AroM family protein [Gemmatimonadota bacterium]|nr:AroM family protein [Gemmatimonadota bacterium]